MAREVITRTWCDLCLSQEVHTEADHTDHVAITAPGRVMKPLSLDLCELHRKELLGPVIETLEEFGAPVEFGGVPAPRVSRVDSANPVPACKVPGCPSNGGRPFKSHASFGAHVRQQHGLTLVQYRAEYGAEFDGVSPPPAAPIGEDEEFKCPDCPKVYSHELGNARPSQALGVHRAKTHGFKKAAA